MCMIRSFKKDNYIVKGPSWHACTISKQPLKGANVFNVMAVQAQNFKKSMSYFCHNNHYQQDDQMQLGWTA